MLGPDLSQGPGAVPDGGDHGLKIDHSPCDATVDMCAQSGQLCRRLLKAPRKQLLAHVIQRRLPQPGSERVQRFSEKPERLHADHSRCECEQRLSLERLAKTVDGDGRYNSTQLGGQLAAAVLGSALSVAAGVDGSEGAVEPCRDALRIRGEFNRAHLARSMCGKSGSCVGAALRG